MGEHGGSGAATREDRPRHTGGTGGAGRSIRPASAAGIGPAPVEGGGFGAASVAAERPAPASGIGPARFVFGALTVAVVAMALLHLFGIGRLDPATTTVSDYVALPGGATLLALAVLGVAAATAGVTAAQLAAGAPRRLAVPFGIGCVGLVATIAFPTNVIGTATTANAVLHRYAAGLFFVSLPIAAFLSLRHHPSRTVTALTTLSVLVGLTFLASHVPLVLPDWPGAHQIGAVLPRGIAERALLTVDIALLAALAGSATRAPRKAAR
ncbi:MAG TPA: DUF998 domain-containing protein [Pseudonocardiaceae bacterium]|nr:DUF998 domain-containing protein [Pseudonocardiaceae bacterium]